MNGSSGYPSLSLHANFISDTLANFTNYLNSHKFIEYIGDENFTPTYRLSTIGLKVHALGSVNLYYHQVNTARQFEEQYQTENRYNNKWSRIGTLTAASATSLLVLIEIIKHFQWVFSVELLTGGFLYLCGILTSIAILLIVKEVLSRK